jgi:hypothetical protein
MLDIDGNELLHEYQDLGESKKLIRRPEETGRSGVEVLVPDGGSQTEALEQIRDVIDEHYGNNLDRLCDDDERVVINRLVLQSDDLPHIEYRIVDEDVVDK